MKEVEDLIIRKLSSNDLNDFREIITQKEVARMAGFAPVSSFASFYLSQMLQNGAWGLVVNKKVVGVICIYDLPIKNGNKKTGEIGFILNQNYWYRGYMSKAIEEICSRVKEDYSQIKAITLVDNIASKKVLERNDFYFSETIMDNDEEKNIFLRNL